MPLVIENASHHTVLTPPEVEGFEHRLGIRLPDDYRSFLLTHNGGVPRPDTFWVSCTQGFIRVARFYGLVREPYFASLPWHVRTYCRGHSLDLLPIGCDPGGNQICLGVAGPRPGGVYYWDRDVDDALTIGLPGRNLFLVAASFTTLLQRLSAGARRDRSPTVA